MGIPARRRHIAGRAFIEAAAAVLRAGGNLFFHVALDGVPAPLCDELRGGFGVCAIGHRIAGVNDVPVSNTLACLESGEGFECLQVAISTATNQDRGVERAKVPARSFVFSLVVSVCCALLVLASPRRVFEHAILRWWISTNFIKFFEANTSSSGATVTGAAFASATRTFAT
jgi:hypothetical protein